MNQATESRGRVACIGGESLPFESASAERIFKWLPVLECCLIAILAAALVVLTLIPGWSALRSEFPNYYLAAELYHQGIALDRVYEWTWFQRQNDHLKVRDGLVSFAPNPPSSILPLLPLTRLQPLAAKRAWIVANLVLLAFSLLALRYSTRLGWRRLVLITLLCTLPLRVDFMFARYYILILFLICMAYYAARRNKDWAAGALWSTAAAMKLFPALAVVLFLRKRNWRALTGFVAGGATLAAISVVLFGVEVHQIFIREVLSQASRGDWLGPYSLYQNSFITLWSRFFLFEPDLNPTPLISSHVAYSLAMAVTVTALVCGFLLTMASGKTPHAEALRWASLPPLMLLLSTYGSADHSCILIFSAIVAIDALLDSGRLKPAVALLVIFVLAMAPIPLRMTDWFPHRLMGIVALYSLLLYCQWTRETTQLAKRWWIVGAAAVVVLGIYNFRLADHTEDFDRRISLADGYRLANPVPVASGVGLTEMLNGKYRPLILENGKARDMSLPGDALSVAGSPSIGALYSELATDRSILTRSTSPGIFEKIGEGQDPALSANGKWLAFIREEKGIRSGWLVATDSSAPPKLVLADSYAPLDLTVTNGGDVIAAAGKVSDPYLLFVRHGTGDVTRLPQLSHPIRYPAVSPDGKRLAFSRRERGSWHLFTRVLATGYEQQLTHAPCNAISPAWEDNHTLLYATDCGRGVGLSALARVVLPD
jgi:hypothetical protein